MRLTAWCIALILCSCNQAEHSNTDSQAKPFEAIAYKNKAFVFSDTLRLYDSKLQFVQTVRGALGKLVTIDSVSIIKFYPGSGDTLCEMYNMIRVSSSGFSGWAYGKDIYEFGHERNRKEDNRDTTIRWGNAEFKLFILYNFGIHPESEEGLTYCESVNPVAIYNPIHDRLDIIPVSDSSKLYQDQFLTLNNSSFWLDKITKTSFENNALHLDIYREYQEGTANIEARIYFHPDKAVAEITGFRKYIGIDGD